MSTALGAPPAPATPAPAGTNGVAGKGPQAPTKAPAKGPAVPSSTPARPSLEEQADATAASEKGEASTTPAPEAPKPSKRTRTFRDGGKEIPVEYADEAHEQRELQRLYGEAMQYRKGQAERVAFEKAREAAVSSGDPFLLWEHLQKEAGKPFDRETYLLENAKKILEASDAKAKDPKGYELEQAQAEIQRLKAEQKQREEQAAAEKELRETNEYVEQKKIAWAKELRELVGGPTGLPGDYVKSALVPRMADIADMSMERGLGWTDRQIAEQAIYEIKTGASHWFKNLDVPALIDFLGAEKVEAIRQHHLTSVAAPKPTVTPAKTVTPARPETPSRRDPTEVLDPNRSWRFGR